MIKIVSQRIMRASIEQVARLQHMKNNRKLHFTLIFVNCKVSDSKGYNSAFPGLARD